MMVVAAGHIQIAAEHVHAHLAVQHLRLVRRLLLANGVQLLLVSLLLLLVVGYCFGVGAVVGS